MQGRIYTGQLTSIDTDSCQIEVTKDNGDAYILPLDPNIEVNVVGGWRYMLGAEVQAIVIDGKVTKVLLIRTEPTIALELR